MEFSISRDEFLRGVNIVDNVAVIRGSMPILSHILIQTQGDKQIYLYGTDLELGIKGGAEAQVESEGSICLSAKMMADILRELPEGSLVHMCLEENSQVKISCGKKCCHLAGLPAEEFPPFPTYEYENLIPIPRKSLRDMITKINITVPLLEQKHLGAPNGALLEIDQQTMEMMGTDGHRLSYIKKPLELELSQKIKVILPKKSLVELKRILDEAPNSNDPVLVGFFENQVVFKIGQIELFSRLLETYFPNIRPRIAKVNDKIVQIRRQEFRQAVKMVSIFTEDREKYIRLNLNKDTLTINSQSFGVGDAEDQVAVVYDGEPLEIGFNAGFILDALNILDEEQIIMEMSDQNSPGVIRSPDSRDYLYLMMPIKLYETDEF